MPVNALCLNEQSRLLLVAPHPDDESLACSVILQRAVRARAAIKVIYATDGDNNLWPQRMVQRKWRITPFDRAEWGRLRRQEALQALTTLGVEHSEVEFLALPDQGVTDMLLSDCEPILNRLAQYITHWGPTHILCPDISDIHPDHSALGVMLRLVSERLDAEARNHPIWNFLVHGNNPEFRTRAVVLPQTTDETITKLKAINCHKTQLKLSRSRFTSYALEPERLAPGRLNLNPLGDNSTPRRNTLRFLVTTPGRFKAFFKRRPKLLLLGHAPSGQTRSLCVPVCDPDNGSTALETGTGECAGVAAIEALAPGELQVDIPLNSFSVEHEIYLKLEMRGIFFDVAGWTQTREGRSLVGMAEDDAPVGLSLALN